MNQNSKISDMVLEKLAAGEFSEEMTQGLLQQLEEDADAKARYRENLKSNDEILEQYAPRQMAASIKERAELETAKPNASSLKYFLSGALVASAVALALFFLQINPSEVVVNHRQVSESKDGGYVGLKGDAQLHLYKKRGNGQDKVASGDTLKEGDEVQIRYNTVSAKGMVICSVDGGGNVTLHFPEDSSKSTLVKPLSKNELPYGYQLDDAPSFERFFLVWSDTEENLNVDAILNSIKSLKDSQNGTPELDDGLRYKELMIKK